MDHEIPFFPQYGIVPLLPVTENHRSLQHNSHFSFTHTYAIKRNMQTIHNQRDATTSTQPQHFSPPPPATAAGDEPHKAEPFF